MDEASAFKRTRQCHPVVRLTILFIIILAAKVTVAWHIPGPWYLPDEVRYIQHAHAIAEHGDLSYCSPGSAGMQPFWPLMLAPIFYAFSSTPDTSYFVSLVLSSLLGTLVMFPTYALSRQWLPAGMSALVAILATVMPGNCIYGWAVLKEPLYTLLVTSAAWTLVRLLWTGQLVYFALCAAISALSLWCKPFGAGYILALWCSTLVWFALRRRWWPMVFIIAAMLIVVAAVVGGGKFGNPSVPVNVSSETDSTLVQETSKDIPLTNIRGECEYFRKWLGYLKQPKILRELGIHALRDVMYLLVATFGVFFPLATGMLVHTVTHWRRISTEGRGLFIAVAIVSLTTIFLTVMMQQMERSDFMRMYGRYLEPQMPIILIAAVVYWHQEIQNRTSRRKLSALVVILTGLLIMSVPRGVFSFTNNPGFWYWAVLQRYLPGLLGAGVLLIFWGVFLLFWKRKYLVLGAMIAASILSTLLVARQVHLYNREVEPMRQLAREASDVLVTLPTQGRLKLWVDPVLQRCHGASIHNFVSLLRYEQDRADIEFAAKVQTMDDRDLFLTASAPGIKPLWSSEGISIIGGDQLRAAETVESPPGMH